MSIDKIKAPTAKEIYTVNFVVNLGQYLEAQNLTSVMSIVVNYCLGYIGGEKRLQELERYKSENPEFLNNFDI